MKNLLISMLAIYSLLIIGVLFVMARACNADVVEVVTQAEVESFNNGYDILVDVLPPEHQAYTLTFKNILCPLHEFNVNTNKPDNMYVVFRSPLNLLETEDAIDKAGKLSKKMDILEFVEDELLYWKVSLDYEDYDKQLKWLVKKIGKLE